MEGRRVGRVKGEKKGEEARGWGREREAGWEGAEGSSL